MQRFLPLHVTPQPPQFESSVAVSTHAPEQREKPASHTGPQTPPVQAGVPWVTAGQGVPHAPQWATLVLVSTQPLPQRLYGRMHWKSQPVALQAGIALLGAVQTVPHVRQLEVSRAKSTQDPLHAVSSPHSAPHTPALHTLPAPQAVVQLPQCCPSDCRSTQLPLQLE